MLELEFEIFNLLIRTMLEFFRVLYVRNSVTTRYTIVSITNNVRK